MQSPERVTRISELQGQRLGPYELISFVGRGGMAVVYKALQPALRRHVAIKVLPPYFVHEEGFRVRFQQEAETVAHLEHPNILPIYDFGQEGDVPYIVMPLVSGGTLRDWLSKSVPLERALQVFSRILAALEYAHSQRVVHRDIKPSNILMSQGDWPLLTDFGIAKIVEPSLRVTRSGTMVGTPEYMSPEQSQGVAVDQRADLYAMGIILYEMLTGRLPFQGQTPVAIILQHVRDAVPPPSSINPKLSPLWDEVIRYSLAKEPKDRYPSAKAMDEAIQAAWHQVKRESGEFQTVASDPRELYDSAAKALAAGDWQRVISLCGQLLEIDPAHPEAVHLLTQAHEALRRQRSSGEVSRAEQLLYAAGEALVAERYAEAIGLYQEALQTSPALTGAQTGLQQAQRAQHLASLYQAARADLAAEQWDAAAARLDELAAVSPDYRDAALLRGQVAAQREREARLAAWYDAGVAAFGRQDWAQAIPALEQVVTAAPMYRDAGLRLAEARRGAEVQRALVSARATLAAGHAADAVPMLETVVRQVPGNSEAHTLLAQARAAAMPGATIARPGAAPPPPAQPTPMDEGRGIGAPAPAARWGSGAPAPEPPAPAPTRAGREPVTTAAGLRVADSAPAVAAPTLGVGAPVVSPVNAPAAAPVLVPVGAERGGNGLKLVLSGGLVAVALVAGVVAWQRFAPGPPSVAAGSSVPVTASVNPVTTEAKAEAPTTTPTPGAADLFPTCQSAVAAGIWTDALAACQKVEALDAGHAGLADALATTYVALGKEQVAQGAPLANAVAQFDKALAAKPEDGEAEQQRAWALAYQEGQTALDAENWPLATDKLDQLYTVAPDYRAPVDGGVKQALYSARLGWGQALLTAGSYADARQKCDLALALIPDSSAAADCQGKAVAALAPPSAAPARSNAPAAAPAAPAAPARSNAPAAAPAPAAPRSTGGQPAVAAPAPAAPAAPAVAAPPTRAPAVEAKPTFTPRY